MQEHAQEIVESPAFNRSIAAVIILNAIVIGLSTQLNAVGLAQPEAILALDIIDNICLGIYIAEMFVKLWIYRLDYFKSGWNLFDFTIIVLSIVPFLGFDARIVRVFRVLRVVRTMRLFGVVKDLQRVLEAIIKSLPAIASTIVILIITFFIYAVIGVELYRDIAPESFGDLSAAFLSLFQVTTLDNWINIAQAPMAADGAAWLYFTTFVIITAFVIVNIIVGVIVNAMETNSTTEEARDERNFSRLDGQMQDVQAQLAAISEALADLKGRQDEEGQER